MLEACTSQELRNYSFCLTETESTGVGSYFLGRPTESVGSTGPQLKGEMLLKVHKTGLVGVGLRMRTEPQEGVAALHGSLGLVICAGTGDVPMANTSGVNLAQEDIEMESGHCSSPKRGTALRLSDKTGVSTSSSSLYVRRGLAPNA
ncbi:hypothetical protein R1flu_019923 [Riccia fluitans]|uniref:Uncharacterized protein n=1 Tax=Riccia fluitans TaxID=41844 RepID=A0ABD1ZK17_9MARC